MKTIVAHLYPCPLAEPKEARPKDQFIFCQCPQGYPRRVCALCGREQWHASDCPERGER